MIFPADPTLRAWLLAQGCLRTPLHRLGHVEVRLRRRGSTLWVMQIFWPWVGGLRLRAV